jgi:hypothetical protein
MGHKRAALDGDTSLLHELVAVLVDSTCCHVDLMGHRVDGMVCRVDVAIFLVARMRRRVARMRGFVDGAGHHVDRMGRPVDGTRLRVVNILCCVLMKTHLGLGKCGFLYRTLGKTLENLNLDVGGVDG